jgi:hypothetical protein
LLFHEPYGYFDGVNKGYVMNIQYQFRTLNITYRRRSRLVVITMGYFRNFGHVECEDIQPGILYSDIYTIYADRGRDNELSTGSPYVLAVSMLHVTAVTLLRAMFETTVVKEEKKKKSTVHNC